MLYSLFMSDNELTALAGMLGVSETVALVGFVAIALWSLVWKGLALWAAARGEQQWWFIIILIVNTAGILEIIYLLFFRKREG
jgi:hypothetical protein